MPPNNERGAASRSTSSPSGPRLSKRSKALALHEACLLAGFPVGRFVPMALWRKAARAVLDVGSRRAVQSYTRIMEEEGLLEQVRVGNVHGVKLVVAAGDPVRTPAPAV